MKTIRARLTTGVLIVVCLTFLAVSTSVFYAIGHLYRESEGDALCENARRLSVISSGIMGRTELQGLPYSNLLQMVYEEDIQAYSEKEGYYIFTVDKYNRQIFASANTKEFINKKKFPTKQIEKVLNGESIRATGALSLYYETEVITAAEPVIADGEIIGAVFCSLPIKYLSKMRAAAMGSILLVMIPVLIVSLIVTYVISRRITNPITNVSRVAKMISTGNLSARVRVKTYENEIGELAKNFNDMADTIENADRMKNNFISDVSHELRTPMTSVIGFLRGIQDGVIPEDEHGKYIEICLEESKRLSRLVTRLLEISKMESGENEIHPSDFDINEKIRTAVFCFEDKITDKNIKVKAEFVNEKLFVFADEDGIDRVIINLLDNAIKFSPENSKILIKADRKGDKAEISIANEGDLDSDTLQKMWDKFYKSDKSRSREGAGLGLYFVKKILKNHNEKITVSCEEIPGEQNIYTKFVFQLKIAGKESIKHGSKN